MLDVIFEQKILTVLNTYNHAMSTLQYFHFVFLRFSQQDHDLQ